MDDFKKMGRKSFQALTDRLGKDGIENHFRDLALRRHGRNEKEKPLLHIRCKKCAKSGLIYKVKPTKKGTKCVYLVGKKKNKKHETRRKNKKS